MPIEVAMEKPIEAAIENPIEAAMGGLLSRFELARQKDIKHVTYPMEASIDCQWRC